MPTATPVRNDVCTNRPLDSAVFRRSLSPVALAEMAEGLATTVSAAAVPLSDQASRSYAQLLATDDYEVWLVAWGASGALDLHDHGGSIGVIRVVEGALVESYTDLFIRHPLRSATISAGQAVALPLTRVHEVWNPGPSPALSIHVYSPPLTTMTFFDHRPAHFLDPIPSETASVVL